MSEPAPTPVPVSVSTSAMRCVMVVEDDYSFGELLRYQLQRAGYEAHIFRSGEDGLAHLAELDPDVLLLDVMLPGKDGCVLLGEIHGIYPDLPIIMITAAGSIEMAVDCIKKGAYNFLTKPFDFDRLQVLLRNGVQVRDLKARVSVLEGALVKAHGFDQIVAHSNQMRQVIEQGRRASLSDSDVLILGESGSGKEILARAVHFNSQRKKGPFVAINCGAIPESLLESELFGHERGAFTGAANRRIGCFEQANGGTLFLDEIGEMRPEMQVRLLRAVENREIRRVGGERTIKVNTRVISATNQKINSKSSTFRPDLYYRLAILILEVPPLREHPDDVPPLAQYFLDDARREGHTRATHLAPDALSILIKYQWPGNVRELRNAIERAVVFEDSTLITPASLPPEIVRSTLGPNIVNTRKLTETYTADAFKSILAQTNSGNAEAGSPNSTAKPESAVKAAEPVVSPAPAASVATTGTGTGTDNETPGDALTLEQQEKLIILRTLAFTGGNISQAARRLGVHRSTLHRKMARFGLATDEQLAEDAALSEEA